MSPSSTPRQTLTYLRHLFQEHGLHPKSKLGQSFLIDLNLLDLVVNSAELCGTDVVLEVGTGTGSLTARLSDRAGFVLSVEIDPELYRVAGEVLGPRDNVFLLHADVLKRKNDLNPIVIQNLREILARTSGSRLKLVANLPYAVATPAIINLLLSDLPLERIVAMVQSEVAERLSAQPGTKDYGSVAVLVQSLAHVEMIRGNIPPAAFWPRPKVSSAIVRIRPDEAKRSKVGDVRTFRDFLRALYSHRRKNLRSAIASLPWGSWKKSEVEAKLAVLGLDGRVRAENLNPAQHRLLMETFFK